MQFQFYLEIETLKARINPDVKANYLASPPLVVAYALAGNMNFDLYKSSLGKDKNGKRCFLKRYLAK